MAKNKKVPWNVLVQEERGESSHLNAQNEENSFAATTQRKFDGREDDDRDRARVDERRINSRNAEERLVHLNRNSMEDVLYLHPNDHASIQLVGAPLTGTNFYAWSRAIRRALGARNKLDFINGNLIEPPPESPYYKPWLKADYMVSTWITNSMTKELASAFQYIDDSKQLWDEIRQRFDRSSGPKIYRIRREMSSYVQGNQSVMMYFNNLNALWDELNLLISHPVCTCGAANGFRQIADGEKLMVFLLGLNDTFDTVRSQILLLEPLPTVSRAYSMVLQDEDQRIATAHTHHIEESAMYANNKSFNSSGKGAKEGGYRNQLSKEEKRKLKCSHCNESGHEIQDCFKLHGYPDWYKTLKEKKYREQVHCATQVVEDCSENPFHNQKYSNLDVGKLIQDEVAKCFVQYKSSLKPAVDGENVNLVNSNSDPFDKFGEHFAFSIVNDVSNNDWIIDSGASNHICCNARLMKSVEKLCTPQRIFLPNGSMQWVYLSGTAYLNSDILLERVLLVPTFTHNLISVAQLDMDLSVKCTFLDTHCLIQKKLDDHIVGVGKSLGKLYIMSSKDYSQISNGTHPNELTAADWHCLLGHVSISIMKHIPAVKDLCTQDACNQIAACEVCHKFEQSKNKFPLLQRRTDKPFTLVHADIWGPYHAANISNTSYVLTMVDDYSRVTWTYLLSSKQQVYGVLKSFIHMIKTQFGADILQIKFDSGSEFIGDNVKELFGAAGIMYERTCGYNSQQSGVVEKKHQTLLQVARALMFQNKLPIRFWPQSILAATWIMNRMPHCLLDWQNPYYLLFGQAACLDQLKPFGSLVYVPNPTSQREKVDSQSITCVMLGVAQNHKGYILYDMKDQRIFTSRNIHCFETAFPFAQSDSFSIPSTDISVVPPAVISDTAPYVHDFSIIDSASITSSLPINSDVSSIPIPIELSLVDDSSSSAHFGFAEDVSSWLTDFVANYTHSSSSFIPSEVQFSILIVFSSIIVLHSINSLLNMEYIKAHIPYFDACQLVEWIEPMNKELDAVKIMGLGSSFHHLLLKWFPLLRN